MNQEYKSELPVIIDGIKFFDAEELENKIIRITGKEDIKVFVENFVLNKRDEPVLLHRSDSSIWRIKILEITKNEGSSIWPSAYYLKFATMP